MSAMGNQSRGLTTYFFMMVALKVPYCFTVSSIAKSESNATYVFEGPSGGDGEPPVFEVRVPTTWSGRQEQ